MKEILNTLIFSLEQVEVHGKKNLDIMLGCIQTLEKLRDMVKTKTEVIEPEEGTTDDHHDEQRADV